MQFQRRYSYEVSKENNPSKSQVDCHACIGGTNIAVDIRSLEAHPHIVVGTPGRVKDMIERKVCSLYHVADLLQDSDVLRTS